MNMVFGLDRGLDLIFVKGKIVRNKMGKKEF